MSDKSYDWMKNKLLHELNFLRSLGIMIFIYPFIGKSKTANIGYGFVFFLIILTATQLIITLCLKDFKDWVQIVNVVPNLAVVLMSALKYITVYMNQPIYHKIFEHFRNDLWDVVHDCKQHKKIVVKYSVLAKFVTRFLFYYSVVLIIFVFSFPRLMMYLETFLTGEECEALYPFDGWYPFDKAHWYYVAYIWEGFMTSVVVCIYGIPNMFNSSFTIFMCMELKVLGRHIENLITRDDVVNLSKYESVRKTHLDIKRRLRYIIIRHQFLAQ